MLRCWNRVTRRRQNPRIHELTGLAAPVQSRQRGQQGALRRIQRLAGAAATHAGTLARSLSIA